MAISPSLSNPLTPIHKSVMEYITLSRSNGTTSKGSPYCTLKVANLQETITVAVWDTAPTQGPTVGQLVTFMRVRDNEGKKSASYPDMITGQMATPDHELYGLVPHATTQDQWEATIATLLSYCEDDVLKSVIQTWAPKLYQAYLPYPAATSVHHAFPGGLVTHTWQMLHMLEGLYPCLPYKIKVERCILGILFHDYGKQQEYDAEGNTQESMYLLGHIYMSAMTLQTILPKAGVDKNETNRIVHCILAHHGSREYGSPVVPCMQEAVIINLLDNLSAKTDAIEFAGNLERVFALDTHVVKG